MDFAPLLSAKGPIPLHAFAAFAALGVGAAQLALPKGTLPHRLAGWFWVGGMAVVAVSSFFINEIRLIGPFSPIHLLSVLTLVGLWQAVRSARLGKIDAHRRHMRNLFFYALILAGAFTLLPGRIMHQILF